MGKLDHAKAARQHRVYREQRSAGDAALHSSEVLRAVIEIQEEGQKKNSAYAARKIHRRRTKAQRRQAQARARTTPRETVEEFLKRGGQIQTCENPGASETKPSKPLSWEDLF